MKQGTAVRAIAVAAILALPIAVAANAQTSALQPARLGGYVIARETWQKDAGLSASLYRARLGADGSLPNRFTYRVLVECESGGNARTAATVALRDAYIRWSRGPWALVAGQYKTPFSREYLTSITAIETAERSAAVDSLAPKRDIGVMAEYSLGPDATVSLGVFNGEGQNIPVNRDSVSLVVGRVSARPISGAQLAAEFARDSPDSLRWGWETSLEQRGFLLRGEYLLQRVRGARRMDFGWCALAGWRVVPWAQLVVKQEDFERPRYGPARQIRATTAGLNLDLGAGRTRLVLDVVRRSAGAKQARTTGAIAQLQARF